MLFALFDVGVEIGEPFDAYRFKTSDIAQAFDVSRGESDMYAKLQHVFAKRGPHQIQYSAQKVFCADTLAQDRH